MPLPKKVATLNDLCLEDFAKNIIYHSECFRQSEKGGRTRKCYKRIQRFYTDITLEKFSMMIDQKEQLDDKTKEFISIFFLGKKTGNSSDWPCLEFLFNKYTTSISFNFKTAAMVPEVTTDYISSRCKNLGELNAHSHYMCFRNVSEAFSQFQCLQFVDADFHSGRDVLRILEICPLITSLSTRYTRGLSDDILLSLCKHRSTNKFEYCPEDGNCSTAGKNLQFFHTGYSIGSDFNTPGIACALQHCPKLKSFPADQIDVTVLHNRYLPDAILMLLDSALEIGKPLIYLELTSLYFRFMSSPLDATQLRRIFYHCPKLELLQVGFGVDRKIFTMSTFENVEQLLLCSVDNRSFYSSELQQLLAVQGKKIRALYLINDFILDVEHFYNILDACCNLKELYFFSDQQTGNFLHHTRKMPSAVAGLEKINLELYGTEPKSLFYELLCRAKSLKCISLVTEEAEKEFSFAMEKNDFCCLEKLYISSSEIGQICLDKLMNQGNRLRKVRITSLTSVEHFRKIAEQKNYDLDIGCHDCDHIYLG